MLSLTQNFCGLFPRKKKGTTKPTTYLILSHFFLTPLPFLFFSPATSENSVSCSLASSSSFISSEDDGGGREREREKERGRMRMRMAEEK